MFQIYSRDLRQRIVAFVEAGHSRRSAARHFGVSDSFAVKLLAKWRDQGTLAPSVMGRPSGGGKLAAYKRFLAGCVDARPDVTLPELADILEATHGVRAHPSSLSRFLISLGYSYKKNAHGHGARTRGCPPEKSAVGQTSEVYAP